MNTLELMEVGVDPKRALKPSKQVGRSAFSTLMPVVLSDSVLVGISPPTRLDRGQQPDLCGHVLSHPRDC